MTDWTEFKKNIAKSTDKELETLLAEEKLNYKRSKETHEVIKRECGKSLAVSVENELKVEQIEEELKQRLLTNT